MDKDRTEENDTEKTDGKNLQRTNKQRSDLPQQQQKEPKRKRSKNVRCGPWSTSTTFNTQAGTTPATLFSSPVWKGAACVFRESRRPFNVSPHHFHYCDKCNPTLCKRCKGPINILPTTFTSIGHHGRSFIQTFMVVTIL